MKKYLVLLVALLMGSLMVSAHNICKQGGGVGYRITFVSWEKSILKYTLYNSNPYTVTVHGWIQIQGKKIGGEFSEILPPATTKKMGKKEMIWKSDLILSTRKGDYSLGGPTARGLVYVEKCN